MTRFIIRIVWVVLGLILALFLLGWAVLAAPMFSDLRGGIVESVLTEQIGQPLVVHDDVSVSLGPISRVHVSEVEIPSENIPDTTLAELKVLTLDVDLIALLNGKVDLDNLTVDGLQVNLLVAPNGTRTWTERDRSRDTGKKNAETVQDSPDQDHRAGEDDADLLTFLSNRTASFTSIGLTYDNDVSGFEFLFDLQALKLEQLEDGARVSLTGDGTVNGQAFEIVGDFPRGAPFTTRASFGGMKLSLDGKPTSADQGSGFDGQLSLDTGEFGDFLEVIGLGRTLEGTGKLHADLTSRRDRLAIENLEIEVQLQKGQLLNANGSVENLLRADGIDVTFDGRFHPEGQPPKPATNLKEVKLTGISAHVVSGTDALRFKDLRMMTNAFDQGLDEVGPVSIGRIRRTQEGWLALEDVSLQAGPDETPYIVATGNIRNLLQLQELDMQGTLSAPASLVLKDLGDDVADAFGSVQAEFSIDDSQGFLSLNYLDAYTVDTDIWALKAQAALGDVTKLQNMTFDFALGIEDGASFLSALKLDAVDVGAFEISASVQGQGTKFASTLGLMAGSSRLDATLDTITEKRPVIRGRIFSDHLDINDLKNAVASVVQLASLDAGKSGTENDGVQPLVLPRQEEAPVESDVQPLVLPKQESKPSDLFDLEKLLTETDLHVSIDIKEIVGQKGVSSVSRKFSAKDGKAVFGPLEASYGGGFFKISAEMDVINAPQLVSVSGSTGGWDFGEILDSVGLGIDAHGQLRGRFDITGNIQSARTFVNTMYGSATVSMTQGNISTSLLELAGLGVFPWLFSKELNQGYTDIVCVVAPVRINAGKMSSKSVVAETKSVQLVAGGYIDWKNDAISVRAEPRPVGRPLARSAWPFNVTGKLSAPEFKLDIGGSRTKRRDGATAMPTDRTPCKPDLRQLQ